MTVRKSALLMEVAKLDTAANAGFPAEDVDSCALSMDQALGQQKRALFVVSRWNVHATEFAWSLAPVVCDIFSLAVKACVELQLNWLSWLPGWGLGIGAAQPHVNDAAPIETEEHWSRRLVSSMDIAIGAQPAQPDPAVLPYDTPFHPATLAAAAPEHAGDPPAKPVQQAEPPAEAAMASGSMR